MNHSFIDQVDRVPSFELFHPPRRFPDPRPGIDWWGLSWVYGFLFEQGFYLRVTRFDHFLSRSTVSCDVFLLLVVLLFNDRLIFNYSTFKVTILQFYSTFRVTIVQFYNFRGFFTSTRDFLFQYISWKVIEVSLATVFMERLNKFANDVVDRYIWLSDSILYFTYEDSLWNILKLKAILLHCSQWSINSVVLRLFIGTIHWSSNL